MAEIDVRGQRLDVKVAQNIAIKLQLECNEDMEDYSFEFIAEDDDGVEQISVTSDDDEIVASGYFVTVYVPNATTAAMAVGSYKYWLKYWSVETSKYGLSYGYVIIERGV